MSHRNARLIVHGRRFLVSRVLAGRPIAHVAAEKGISRATAHKWMRRSHTALGGHPPISRINNPAGQYT